MDLYKMENAKFEIWFDNDLSVQSLFYRKSEKGEADYQFTRNVSRIVWMKRARIERDRPLLKRIFRR